MIDEAVKERILAQIEAERAHRKKELERLKEEHQYVVRMLSEVIGLTARVGVTQVDWSTVAENLEWVRRSAVSMDKKIKSLS